MTAEAKTENRLREIVSEAEDLIMETIKKLRERG